MTGTPVTGTPVTLYSRHDPAAASRPVVLLRAQSDALAWAAFAVMTVTLAAVLQGSPVLVPFAVGMTAAFAGSAVVAGARLRRTPARVEVSGAAARLWSVWDAAAPARRPPAVVVWEARLVHGELVVSLGDAVETFARADWPDFDALVDALRHAAADAAGLAPPDAVPSYDVPSPPGPGEPGPEGQGEGQLTSVRAAQ